jgi:Delta3-Delta2-enoyl-CoA isomerase
MNIERSDGIALLRMTAGKANAIGPAWLERMNVLLDELQAHPPRALVVTGEGRAFSAGLDLPALLRNSPESLTAFIRDFSEVMLRFFTHPWPVVAAINGHAIAGGCVLALQADHRLMAAGEGRIGLNEVQLGIGLPVVVVETLRCQVPAASLLPVAIEGALFLPEEALRLGLVQEVVAAEELLERAFQRAGVLGALPGPAFRHIKRGLRGAAVETIRRAEAADAEAWVETFFSAPAQERVQAAVARLLAKR